MRLIVEFTPDGVCLADDKIEDFLTKLLQDIKFSNYEDLDKECNLYIANELILMALRVKVMKKEIHHNNIEFRFKDEVILCNADGRLNHYPNGFCSVFDRYLNELLCWDGVF